MSTKPLSRRTFLRGAGGVMIGIPFLEAMMPSLAWAATSSPTRLVAVYGGTPTYVGRNGLPPVGALGSTLNSAFSSLASVRQHVTLLSNTSIPKYFDGTTPTAPGSHVSQQHGTAPAPLLAGVTSHKTKSMMYQCHTVDQVFADAKGSGTPFKSLQARVQSAGFGYGDNKGEVSARYENGVTNVFSPIVSPLQLYNKLFSGVMGTPSTGASAQVLNHKSVLDLVLGDANRLTAKLSGTDKARMEQHFEEIRAIEKRLATTSPPAAGSCTKPQQPGADPTISNANSAGGWGDETLRGDLQAEILAMAIACDLTRAVSWQLTFDQCGLGSQFISGVSSDLHAISHDVNNDVTGTLQAALKSHLNWHCARFAKLVQKLASLPEGGGSVLDSTFIGMGFGEGISAHNRDTMHMFVAGCPDRLRMGQHIDVSGQHPATMWISALNALGVSSNKLGEVSGRMTALEK